MFNSLRKIKSLVFSTRNYVNYSALSVISSIVLGVLIFNNVVNHFKFFDPAWAALSKNTIGWNSNYQGDLLSSSSGDISGIQQSFMKFKSKSQKVILWLGASQVNSINQYTPGDELAVYYAHESARNRRSNFAYLQAAYPNANFNELLATYIKFKDTGLIPDWLVIAVTYDDLREPGICEYILRDLPDVSELKIIEKYKGLDNLLSAQKNKNIESEPIIRNATDDTPQEKLEKILSDLLAKHWKAFANRGKLSSIISIKLKVYAGLIFGWIMSPFLGEINTVPAIPKDIQQWNEDGLYTLVNLAKTDGVNVLLYRAPHPQYDGDFYHNRQDYENYFLKLKSLYLCNTVHYLDLERIVPLEYWGLNNTGRLDVFHFQARGHQILGMEIDKFFENIENQRR